MRGHNIIIAVITTLVVSQLDSSLAIDCFNCTTSESDTCLTNASGQGVIACPDGNCFTSTDGNGNVTRGCLANGVGNCPGSTNCQTCNTDKCNMNGACYSCTGDSCDAVTNAMLTICVGNDSKCYTTGSSATNMTRGCSVNSPQADKCPTDTTDTSCAICDASLCNNGTYQRQEGSCITCPDCVGAQDASKAAACTILYNQKFDGCYTTTAGVRGCLVSLEGGCTDATNCKSCTTDNCNTEATNVTNEFQCVSCLSNEVSGCWDGTGSALPSVACPNGTCYGGVWNGLGVRGCLTSASELMQYQCVNKVEPYQCKTCTTPTLCNKDSFNGAGSLSQMGVVGLLLGLMVVLRSS